MTHAEYCARFAALKADYRAGRITLTQLNDAMDAVLAAYRATR